MKIENCLLISSRGRFISSSERYFFQEGDGFYLDRISSFFDKTDIIAKEVSPKNVQNETYRLKEGIDCFDTKSLIQKDFFRLISLIRNANIVYVFYPLKSSLIIAIIAKLFDKKVIAYNGGVWSEMKVLGKSQGILSKVKYSFYQNLEYLSILLSNVYIVNNNQLYDYYSPKFDLIKTSPLLRIEKKDVYYREDTNINETVELLCVSHVKEGKKIIEILESFQSLIKSNFGKKFNLTIVGKYDHTSGYAKKVFEYIRENKLNDKITFSGIVNDFSRMIRYYRESDMLILVTESEGFPRVLWEAFSQSLPVICSSLPNIEIEFVDKESPIYTLESNEPVKITKAITDLLNDSALRQNLVQNGLQAFKEKTKETPLKQFQIILNRINEN